VWLADLGQPVGIEQGFRRPVVVVSVDEFQRTNGGRACWCVPVTTRQRGWQTHVEVPPGPSGLARRSFAKVEDLRSVSTHRLTDRLGAIDDDLLSEIRTVALRILGVRGRETMRSR
jgi:mRNA interferase MazF